MNITKGKLKKILKKGNKKQTNKINKKVRFRKNNSNIRSFKKHNKKVNLRIKTLKYGGTKNKRKMKKNIEKEQREPLLKSQSSRSDLDSDKSQSSETLNPLITNRSDLGSQRIEAQKKFQERQNKIKHDNKKADELRKQNKVAKDLPIAPGSKFKPETP